MYVFLRSKATFAANYLRTPVLAQGVVAVMAGRVPEKSDKGD